MSGEEASDKPLKYFHPVEDGATRTSAFSDMSSNVLSTAAKLREPIIVNELNDHTSNSRSVNKHSLSSRFRSQDPDWFTATSCLKLPRLPADFTLLVPGFLTHGMKRSVRLPADVLAVAVAAATGSHLFAADSPSLEERLKNLETQNQLLRNELDAQKQLIDDLKSRLNPAPTDLKEEDLQPKHLPE